jgi:hypothetical protein
MVRKRSKRFVSIIKIITIIITKIEIIKKEKTTIKIFKIDQIKLKY